MLGTNRRRIEWIDAARGLAMCMIVFGHSVPGGFWKRLCYTFHVPVFFFLSGMVFRGDRQENFGKFLMKEFKNLMLPYYGAGILSILVYGIFGKMASSKLDVSVKEGGFFQQIGGMFYGSCKTGYMKWNLPLWFLPCLFGVLLMAWMILRFLQNTVIKRNPTNLRVKVVCLTGIICLVVFFGISLTDKWQIAMMPLGLETGVRMLPFFLAGTGTGWILKDKATRKQTKLMGIFFFCLGICAFSAANNSLVLYHRDEYGKEILFYLGAASGICLVIIVGMLLERCKWLSYIGRHTLVILLFHKFPILFFQVFVPYVGKMLEESSTVAGMSVSAFAILFCLLPGILMEKVQKKPYFRRV